MWTLLIKPNISVSTAYVYGNLDLQKQLDHPDTDAVLDAIAHCDGAKVAHLLSNVLETVTIPSRAETISVGKRRCWCVDERQRSDYLWIIPRRNCGTHGSVCCDTKVHQL